MGNIQVFKNYTSTAEPLPTIGAVLASITGDTTISLKKRRDICSGVRTLCDRLHLQVESTPASPRLFGERLANATPTMLDMSPARLRNCKHLLDVALTYANSQFRRKQSRTPLSHDCHRLLAHAESRWQRIRLSVLFRFICERGLSPDDISDEVVTAFGATLQNSTLKKPAYIDRDTRRAWNMLVDAVPELAGRKVKTLCLAERYVLPASDFPSSLWEELDAYLASRATKEGAKLDDLLTEEELFGTGEDASASPIRSSTADLIRYRVRQFASALVLQKLARPADITSLRVLVAPATINNGLRFFVQRAEGKVRNSQLPGFATDFLMIAQLWVRSPESDLQKLRLLSQKVRPKHDGLPQSARRSLAPFRDIANVRAFLAVPDLIVREAEKQKMVDRAVANRVAASLWIKIAQRAPLRITNLLSTRLDTNVVRSVGKSGTVALIYPPAQVKNKKTLEVPLPQATAALLDLYLKKYRPALVAAESPWLFPAPGGFKRLGVMSADIQRLMREYIGFSINPHSFRHVAAKLYLSVHPGDYENVQLLLGHNSRETTVRYYCDLEAEEAFRHFDAVLLGLTEETQR